MNPWEIVSLGEGVFGRLRRGTRPDVSVVFIDGPRGSGLNAGKLGDMLESSGRGCDILEVELRGSGRSRDLDLTWGVHEAADVVRGVRKLGGEAPLVLAGVSIGASVAILAAARLVEAGRPPALVLAASPYDCFEDAAQELLRFELGMPETMISFHLEQLSILGPPDPLAVAPAVTCPALFLSGLSDTIVRPERVMRLAAAWGGPAEVWELHQAGHTDALVVAMETRRSELRQRLLDGRVEVDGDSRGGDSRGGDSRGGDE